MLLLLFTLLTTVCLVCILAVLPNKDRQEALEKRFKMITALRPAEIDTSTDPTFLESKQGYTRTSLEHSLNKLRLAEQMRMLVLQSGLSLRFSRLVVLTFVSFLTGGLLTAVFQRGFFTSLLGATVFSTFPIVFLHIKRKRRIARFEAALPDAIDLMARSLRAGHSVSAAMEIVAERCAEPLAAEFAQVSQQQRLGIMFRDSVLELANRVPSQDLRFLITGMLVQRESGGDLTDILDGARKVIADRLRIAGKVRVYSAQGRFTGWVLSLLPFVLLLLMDLLNPGYTQLLFTDSRGRQLLSASACSIFMGILVIRKIVNVKV